MAASDSADSSRREFARRVALAAIGGAALSALPTSPLAALSAATRGTPAQGANDVSHDAESIHQVVTFTVPPARVYRALVDPAEFSAMTKFSMVPAAPPARIARDAGGAFVLFDGHILGRHIELVPGTRVVQAWRASDWDAGLYSIARFELHANGGGTTLTFDHTGFPKGQGEHLAQGWNANYWTPMRKHFA